MNRRHTIELLIIFLLITAKAFSYDFQSGGICYNILEGNNVEVTSRDTEYYGNIIIPEKVTYDGKNYSVTNIGSSAFSSCRFLTSITIPNSVTNIGNSAFYYCISLTSITLPNSLTSIGAAAFSSCFGLTSITIPNSVTSIGDDAFYSCDGLTSIIVENGNIKYDSRNSCNAIIETISNSLITGCKTTTIPQTVTSIRNRAFHGCSGLTSLSIPNSVTSIGDDAFVSCTGLTSIIIPNSVTSIGNFVFFNCRGLASVTIPNSVTSIGNGAFQDCYALTSITIPGSVTNIGYSAFSTCHGLTFIDIPNSVTSIGGYAFASCYGLTSITIPSSVTSIGDYAFNGCRGLTSVVSEIVKPFDIGENVFSDYSKPTLTVPSGTKSAYQSTNYWNKFTNIVEASGIDDAWLKEIQEMKSNCEGLLSALPQKIDSEVARLKLRIEEQNIYLQENNKILHGSLLQLSYDLDDAEQRIEEGTMTEEDMQKLREEYERISKAMDEMWQLYDEVSHNIVEAVFQCNEGGVIKLGAYKKIENQQETIRWTTIEKLKFSIEVIPNDGYKIKSIHINGAPASGTTFSSTEINGDFIVQFEKENSNPAKRTIHVETAGTLPDLISESEKYIIEELTLTGELNGTDFCLLRDMGGVGVKYIDGQYEYTNGNLKVLDISKVSIKSGGSIFLNYKYKEDEKIFSVDNDNEIPSMLFSGCKLERIELPNNVTSIGGCAFENCGELTSITIPKGVTAIGSGAFWDCKKLEFVSIPSSVITIGVGMTFSGCHSLTSIDVDSDNSHYQSVNGVLFNKDKSILVYYPQGKNEDSYIIPNGVTTIGSRAFESCKLSSVLIPNSVASIGIYAFWCDPMTIISEIVKPFQISDVFYSSRESKLIVPKGTKEVYLATSGWSSFGSIEEASGDNSSTKRTIHVATAGTLPNLISESEKYTIEELTLTGELNGTDFRLLRDMAGNNYLGQNSSGKLIVLDLTDAKIVVGGEKYLDTNTINGNGIDASGSYHYDISQNNEIPQAVFFGCYLRAISIPNSVTSIGYSAFRDCSGLTSISIPNSVTSIGPSAFSGCSGLTSISIPNSVKSIVNTAFSGCSGLTSIKVESGNIVYDSRNNCNAIIRTSNNELIAGCKNTVIPNSVTSIGNYAFSGCSGLTSISIPNSVTSIGECTFSDCRGLTSITIPNSVTSIGSNAFYECRGLTSISIPNTVTSIGNSAFGYCIGLTSISIPNSVTSIGNSAFGYCIGLTSISIPNSVTSIGAYAFNYCSGLTSISIPNSVKSIGNYAFSGCSGLKDIISEIKTPFKIDEYVFSVYSTATLTVPSGTKPAYQSTGGWNKFTNIVEVGSNNDEWLKKIEEIMAHCWELKKDWSAVLSVLDLLSIEEQRNYYPSYEKDISSLYEDLVNTEKRIKEGNMTNPQKDINELESRMWGLYKSVQEMRWISDDVRESLVETVFECNEGGVIKLGTYKQIANKQEKITWSTLEQLKFSIEVISHDGYKIKSIHINGAPASGTIFSSTDIDGDFIVQFEKDNSNPAKRTIHVATAGTLPNLISDSEKYTIEELTLTGELNGTDFRLLRDMAGNNYKGEITNGKLKKLDISNTKIVAGGQKYLDTDLIDRYRYEGRNAVSYHFTVERDDEFPDGVFESTRSLESVSIPNSVTNVNDRVFYDCPSLKSVSIPNTVKTIGEYAFGLCSGLTSITIPNSVTTIGDEAFRYCSGLTSISLSNSVTGIGFCLFAECSSLTSITIPKSVNTIGYYAFSGCSKLTSIIVESDNPWFLAESGVLYDKKKTTIICYPGGKTDLHYTIPNSVITIGHVAFGGCRNLISITLSDNLTSIGESSFSGCGGLTSITIPKSVDKIWDYAFSNCENLTSIKVESGNTKFDSRNGCNAIIETQTNKLIIGCKSTTIPYSVTSIGYCAFLGCIGLTSVTLPNTLMSIGDYAFDGCTDLSSIVSEIINPFEISEYVFSNYTKPMLTVPSGTKSAYQSTAGWKKFANIKESASSEVNFTQQGIAYRGTTSTLKAEVRSVDYGLMKVEIPSSVSYGGRTYEVTSIANDALSNRTFDYVSLPSTISSISSSTFYNSMLGALIWYANSSLSSSVFTNMAMPTNSNFLLYVNSKSCAPSNVSNVVVGSVASKITLKDGIDTRFYCPKAFTAQTISYTHHYGMTTGGNGKGWETIALPFDVQKIEHKTKGVLTPFALYSDMMTQRPFWLYELGSNGFRRTEAIKANTPYIIAMPNDPKYDEEYILAGDVTFSATNAVVIETESLTRSTSNGKTFIPTFAVEQKASTIYALNVSNELNVNTISYDPGSRFVPNLRRVYPFEAYMTSSSAARSLAIEFEDEVTGIDEIPLKEQRSGNVKVYTLTGLLMLSVPQSDFAEKWKYLPSGVYIVNGQKMIKTDDAQYNIVQ